MSSLESQGYIRSVEVCSKSSNTKDLRSEGVLHMSLNPGKKDNRSQALDRICKVARPDLDCDLRDERGEPISVGRKH